MKTKLCSQVLFGTALLTACGTDDSRSGLATSRDRAGPGMLLVVSGGDQSCKTDASGYVSPYGIDMASKIEGAEAAYAGRLTTVLTCYGGDAPIRFVVGKDAEEQTAEGPAELALALDDVRAESGAGRVAFVGHSHGGWLAMKTSLALQTVPDELVTIDPISRWNCTWTWPTGCFAAPSDFTSDERGYLSEHTSLWINYYQTGTWWLHSGTIDEADENEWLDTSHTAIDEDEVVWGRIRDLLAAR